MWWLWMNTVSAGPLPGAWRLDMELTSRSTVLGVQSSSRLHTVALLSEDDGRHRYEVCDLRPVGGLVQTSISRAWVDGLPSRPVDLWASGDVLSVGLGHQDTGWSPARGPFDDPRSVTDPDEDGHPGVSLDVRLPLLGHGQVYLAQRSTLRLEGVRTDHDRFEGWVHATTRHRVLGASSPLFHREARLEPVPDQSPFTLSRTSATTCSELQWSQP